MIHIDRRYKNGRHIISLIWRGEIKCKHIEVSSDFQFIDDLSTLNEVLKNHLYVIEETKNKYISGDLTGLRFLTFH